MRNIAVQASYLHESAREALRAATSYSENWMEMLQTVAPFYKYNFENAVLIASQRPGATACATMQAWNKRNLWIRKGSKAIYALDPNNPYAVQRVFDISDINASPKHLPSIWSLRQEDVPHVFSSLKSKWHIDDSSDEYGLQLYEAILEIATMTIPDFHSDFEDARTESGLHDLNPDQAENLFHSLVANSAYVIAMKRLGMELPMEFNHEIFEGINFFDTWAMQIAVGAAAHSTARTILRQVEQIVKNKARDNFDNYTSLWNNKIAIENTADRNQNEEDAYGNAMAQNRVQGVGRRNAGSSPELSEATEWRRGQVWRNEAGLSSKPPQGNSLDDGSGRNAQNPSDRGQRAGKPDGRRTHRENDGESTLSGQGDQHFGLDSIHEQSENSGRRNRHSSTDLRIEHKGTLPAEPSNMPGSFPMPEITSQLSFFDAGYPLNNADSITYSAPQLTIPQQVIDQVMADGGNNRDSRYLIVAQFKKDFPIEENANFLRREYKIGGKGFYINGKPVSVWWDASGIRISNGRSTQSGNTVTFSWTQVAKRIRELLDTGYYMSQDDLDMVDYVERRSIAQRLWNVYRDDFLYLPDEWKKGDYPAESTFIAEELAHPEHLNEIIERLRIDVAAADATISQRKRWHNIHQLLADVEALQHIPLDFKASTPYPPVEKRFITQDEIDAALSNGNSFSSGKARIYQFFTQGHTREEQISFLRNEYGIGGRSHALSGADYSWVEYDAKGLVYKRGALTDIYDSVTLKWSQAAKRIGELIQADRFITLAEKEQYQQRYVQQDNDVNVGSIDEVLDPSKSRQHMEIMDSDETDKRFNIIVSNRGPKSTYAVWDNLVNGYYVDDLGNSKEFDSEWQAEAYLEEVLHSFPKQESYGDPEKPPVTPKVDKDDVKFREITLVLNDPDGTYGTHVPNENDVTNLTDQEFASEKLIPGVTTFKRDERTFIVDRIHDLSSSVELRDITFTQAEGYPIFRTEAISTVRQWLNEASDYREPAPNEQILSGTKNPQIDKDDRRASAHQAVNYRIHDDHLGEGGERTKADRNIAAIRTLKTLETENRSATVTEQEILSQYVGWGGISQIFDESNAGWSERRKLLKELLSDEEYISARASTLNAHYTSPVVIRAIYQGLENMGFRQGNILEPSCGIGNFIGMIPDAMQGSKVYGVELDAISGRIAKKLYPEAQIAVQGFEHSQLPDNFFDAAVGNVPFGAYSLADPKYDRHHFRIHDYFFAKSLDKLRPGGLLAFVTSKGTMDKVDSSVRRYIAQRAELLGAIRLPNTAFKANAGTEVTSDILFFQKRNRTIDVEPDWINIGENNENIPLNQYFLAHPEMVLGKMVLGKSLYGNDQETSCVPIPGTILSEQLREAISNIRGQYKAIEIDKPTDDGSRIPANPMVPNFTFTVQDGNVYYRRDHWMERCDLSTNDNLRMRGMIALRNLTRELIQAQLDGANDATIGELQAELNIRYDAFTSQFGLLSDRKNANVFREDDGYYLLTSLEILDDERKLERKADIFTRRTIAANTVIDHVDTASEALAVSMAEHARVDLEYMSSLTGMDKDKLIADLQGLIYQVPENNLDTYSGWQTADEYLSGDVRQKLRIAEHHASRDPRFNANVSALKAVQPADLEPHEIDVRIGATWIPASDISDFIHEILHTPSYMSYKIRAEFAAATGVWHISNKGMDCTNPLSMTKFGTNRRNAYQLIEEALNLRDAKVYDIIRDENGNEKRVLNQKETILAQQKQSLIREAFRDWIWKAPERRERLCRLYNVTYNSIRPREYDGAHLRFPGMNPELMLRPHQKNAVARILYGGNTLLAHTVGAGKTAVMVASIMEKVRIGLGHKALIAVPNHLTEQTAAEFLRFFPSAKVLVATKRDFEKQNRKQFMGRVATGDYNVIIMGHSQFEKVPISKERQAQMLEDQIQELIDGIEELKYSRGERFSVKQMEASRKSLEVRLKKLNSSEDKDSVITFEELGVDMLYVDEAHGFKNLAVITKMRNVAGINTNEAKKSSDMYMKCRYISEITDNRGVVFATGTPISNSMTELYTMQRYLQHTELTKRGLSHFDSWAANFGETVTAIELAPEGTGYRLKTRFSKFFNLPELMTMFKQVADIQTPDMLNLPVPALKDGKTLNIRTEASTYQKHMVQMLGERAEAVRKGNVDPRTDNMLKITNDGRLLALDARLIDPTLPDDPNSKINACVREVLRIHQAGEHEKLTQLIFCDLSTPKSEKREVGFDDVYHDIRRKLVKNGVAEQEIAFIHDADTDLKKDELFAKVRKGTVRILIGSTAKMGAGTNVQTRLKAIHHLDCPWRPSDLQQRDGRILRQGNTNSEVEIIRYITQDTFDAYSYQLVENKQKFVSQIFTSKSPVRGAEDLDEMALSYAEVKALAAGNPLIREKMDLDVQVSRLKLLKSNWQSERYRLEQRISIELPREIMRMEHHISQLQKDIELFNTHHSLTDDAFMITLMDQRFEKRVDAGEYLMKALSIVHLGESMRLGEYCGFTLRLMRPDMLTAPKVEIQGEASYFVELGESPLGNIQRIENLLSGLKQDLVDNHSQLENIKSQLESACQEMNAEWPQEKELQEKSARLAELNVQLDVGGGDSGVAILDTAEDPPEITPEKDIRSRQITR